MLFSMTCLYSSTCCSICWYCIICWYRSICWWSSVRFFNSTCLFSSMRLTLNLSAPASSPSHLSMHSLVSQISLAFSFLPRLRCILGCIFNMFQDFEVFCYLHGACFVIFWICTTFVFCKHISWFYMARHDLKLF